MSGPGENGVGGSAGKGRAACVLLHAPGTAVPTDLLGAISKKISNIRVFTDAYLALAEVFASGQPAAAAVVIIEPATTADSGELIDAMRLHSPQTPIWWYARSVPDRLRRLGAGERTPWADVAVEPTPRAETPPAATGPRLAPTLGPETPRLKPGGAAAFRPSGKGAKSTNEPPRVVVRPGGGIGIRRLRLVGEEAETRPPRPVPPPPKPLVLPRSGGEDIAGPGVGSPLESEGAGGGRIPLLTEEELRMLLADDEPDTSNGPGKERSGP